MDIYLVGGAVRDKLLGLPVKERDWVVVGATPQEMLDLGYQQVGKNFPVFLHPDTKDEYALARTERKTAPGYTGFAFHASPDVSLAEDLKRRDLTINAMAETADGELIDPYGGRDDLNEGRLRHVSPAFAEDPVRVLRVARLAARFGKWGFSVTHGTNALMRQMVAAGEVDHLVPERVWTELNKALRADRPDRFFTVLHGCNALAVLFPEIERDYTAGDNAHDDSELPAALDVLKTSAGYSDDPRVRFAILLLSLDSTLTPQQRLQQAESICRRFKAPNDYTQLAGTAIRLADSIGTGSAEALLAVMDSAGAFRDPHRWQQLLTCYRVTGIIQAQQADLFETARAQAAAVSAHSVNDGTLNGPALGQAIREQRIRVIEQILRDGKQPDQ